jgi:hypothetical protein
MTYGSLFKIDYMNQKIKLLTLFALIILIIGIVVVGLFAVSFTQNFIFSSDLRVVENERDDVSSHLTVYDGETMLGNIYFIIEPGTADGLEQNRITISLSLFYNQTELDSIAVRFSASGNIVSIFKEATSYTWKYEFHTKGSDVIFEVPDLGWFGQSTTKLDFILFPMDANNLDLDMQLSMHRTTPLQLTSLKAQVHIEATIPQVNA